MNSIERVKKAIYFETPDRLPVTGNIGETDFSGDTVAIFPEVGYKSWLGGGGTDEWGSLWQVDEAHPDMGQVKNKVLENLTDFKTVKLPDSSDPKRYAHWPQILDRAQREQKYVVMCNGSYFFERAHFLFGFSETLIGSMIEPELTRDFMFHLAEYHMKTIEYINTHFPGRIHGYRCTDDWGSQSAPLTSPRCFQEVYQPVYEKVFGAIRKSGMDVWMHSCGQLLEIIPHLIKAGLQVINVTQPNVFPIPRLAELKGQICFETCADAQSTLPRADTEGVCEEIRGLLEACCTEGGGLIVEKLDKMYFDGFGISPEMGLFCLEEFRRQDPFVGRN